MQARDDFFAGALVGGGGQGDTRNVREQLGQLPQLQVFRAEIVTPLRYTVGFVDGEQGNLQVLQKRQHARLDQTLGRQVEHLDLAQANAVCQFALLIGAEGGVQCGGGYTQFFQGRHLIVHQGDQRRDHHRQTFAQQAGHLEAQRLATTGRHQHQRITTAGYTFNNGTLATTEAVIAEDVFKYALSLFEHKNPRLSCYSQPTLQSAAVYPTVSTQRTAAT